MNCFISKVKITCVVPKSGKIKVTEHRQICAEHALHITPYSNAASKLNLLSQVHLRHFL